MSYCVPFGKGKLCFEVPKEFQVTVIEPNSTKFSSESIKNINAATQQTLQHPINSKPLSELAQEKKTACIVVTDITRACPDKEILPAILANIENEVEKKNITILIASGMHREMTYEEKISKYGRKIVDSYNVIDHNAKDEKNLVNLGATKNGTPIKLSRIAFESDLLVSIGVVEPHQYAGYSGGYKTVAIGVAGDETISYTHSPRTLKNPKARIGSLEENPFQQDVVEIGRKAGLNFVVNVILGKNKNEVLKISAGEPLHTHRTLVKEAKKICEVPINQIFDVIVCGVGFPKDSNLYQASRAASYLYYAARRPIKAGGYILIPACCEEGAGKGVGEQRFLSTLKDMTLKEILNSNDEFKAGQQRAFVMAGVLQYCKVIIVGSSIPDVVRDAKMIAAKDMQEAFSIVKEDLGSKVKVLIVPNSQMTLPILQ